MSVCSPIPVHVEETPSRCPVCGRKARGVARLTIQHLLKESALDRLADQLYYFCATPECPIVYFSNDANSFFSKHDMQVRVGLKETEDPVPICYCFGFTEKMVLDGIREKGCSNIPDRIRMEVKAGNCACEVKNPSGNCCLGVVSQVVRKALSGLTGASIRKRLEVCGTC